jgi:hypothetical protein
MKDFSVSSIKNRYLFLLISLLLLFVLHPFARGDVIGINILDIFFMIILLAGIYAVSYRKNLLFFALSFALTAFCAGVLIYFIKIPVIILIRYISFILFFFLAIVAILSHMLKAEKVTADIIYGSICVYLLIGIMWAMIFAVIEIIQPSSFLSSMNEISVESSGLISRSNVRTLIYYSFVTLTTLGYGDITPSTPPARMFSTLEAITGQIYLAVLIAHLVGLHIVHSKRG